MCDPEFLGYHLLGASELSTLAVAKQFPEERVGNIVSIDGCVQIIEYSDLPAEAAQRRKPDGSLELWAGNTAIHIFSIPFLARVAATADSLPFHVAVKPVPYTDPATGQRVEPSTANALKFEQFIFDLMPMAKNALVVEGDARRTFAPLKNASGAKSDSPETVRAQMSDLYRQWLEAAGAQVEPDAILEISPWFALDADELRSRIQPSTRIAGPTYLSTSA